jgi:hypothetical protein
MFFPELLAYMLSKMKVGLSVPFPHKLQFLGYVPKTVKRQISIIIRVFFHIPFIKPAQAFNLPIAMAARSRVQVCGQVDGIVDSNPLRVETLLCPPPPPLGCLTLVL